MHLSLAGLGDHMQQSRSSVAAILGPGDHIWQHKLTQDGPGDHIWDDSTSGTVLP